MPNDKIFCGKGRKFGKYNQVGINICLDDIPPEYKTPAANGKVYIKLNLSERKQTDEHGNSHYLTVDTWKPDRPPTPQYSGEPAQPKRDAQAEEAYKDAEKIDWDSFPDAPQDDSETPF